MPMTVFQNLSIFSDWQGCQSLILGCQTCDSYWQSLEHHGLVHGMEGRCPVSKSDFYNAYNNCLVGDKISMKKIQKHGE